MNTKLLYFIVVLFSLVILGSCFTAPPTKTEKKTTSSIYNPFMYRLHPEYVVYCQVKTKVCYIQKFIYLNYYSAPWVLKKSIVEK